MVVAGLYHPPRWTFESRLQRLDWLGQQVPRSAQRGRSLALYHLSQ